MTTRARSAGICWHSIGPTGPKLARAAAFAALAAAALRPSTALAEGPPAANAVAAAPLPPASLGLERASDIPTDAAPLGAGAPDAERGATDPEDKKYEGLLGPLRPGVMVAAAPLPQGAYGVEVGAKYKRWVGAGVQYSAMPTVDIAQASAGLSTLSLNARFHPFRGGFYVGATLGRTSVHAEATEQGRTARAEASRSFVTPGIGWLYTLPSGLTLGFLNLGVNVPLAATLKAELPAEASAAPELKQKVYDIAKPIGQMVLPSIEFFRIGYLL